MNRKLKWIALIIVLACAAAGGFVIIGKANTPQMTAKAITKAFEKGDAKQFLYMMTPEYQGYFKGLDANADPEKEMEKVLQMYNDDLISDLGKKWSKQLTFSEKPGESGAVVVEGTSGSRIVTLTLKQVQGVWKLDHFKIN